MTLADLRRAAELLPPGSSVTLPCAALLSALAEAEADRAPNLGAEADPDRMLTVREVAARMGVAPKMIYKLAPSWPFTRRIGKAVRFESRGLEKWLARQR